MCTHTFSLTILVFFGGGEARSHFAALTGLELTVIFLTLPPKCWDYNRLPPECPVDHNLVLSSY